MKSLKYVAMITAIGTLGLAACGDNTKSPASPATTPAVGTAAMVDNTTAMVDGSTATTGG